MDETPGEAAPSSPDEAATPGLHPLDDAPARAFFRHVAQRERGLRRVSVLLPAWFLVVAAASPPLFQAAGWLSGVTDTAAAEGPPPLSQLDLGLSSATTSTAFTVLSAVVLALQVAAWVVPSPPAAGPRSGSSSSQPVPRESQHRDAVGIARTRVLTQVALLAGGASVFVGYFSALKSGLDLLATRPGEVLVPVFLGLLLAAVSVDASGAIENRTQRSLQEDAQRVRRSLALVGLVRVLGAPRAGEAGQFPRRTRWRSWAVALVVVVLTAGVGASAHPTLGTFLALLVFTAYGAAATTTLGYGVVRSALLHEYVVAVALVAAALTVLAIIGLGSATLLLAGSTTDVGAWAALVAATVVPGAGTMSAAVLLGRRDDHTAGPVRLRLEAGLRSIVQRPGDDAAVPRRRRAPRPRAVLLVVSALVPGLGWMALRDLRRLPAGASLRRLVPAVASLSTIASVGCVVALVVLVVA